MVEDDRSNSDGIVMHRKWSCAEDAFSSFCDCLHSIAFRHADSCSALLSLCNYCFFALWIPPLLASAKISMYFVQGRISALTFQKCIAAEQEFSFPACGNLRNPEWMHLGGNLQVPTEQLFNFGVRSLAKAVVLSFGFKVIRGRQRCDTLAVWTLLLPVAVAG